LFIANASNRTNKKKKKRLHSNVSAGSRSSQTSDSVKRSSVAVNGNGRRTKHNSVAPLSGASSMHSEVVLEGDESEYDDNGSEVASSIGDHHTLEPRLDGMELIEAAANRLHQEIASIEGNKGGIRRSMGGIDGIDGYVLDGLESPTAIPTNGRVAFDQIDELLQAQVKEKEKEQIMRMMERV